MAPADRCQQPQVAQGTEPAAGTREGRLGRHVLRDRVQDPELRGVVREPPHGCRHGVISPRRPSCIYMPVRGVVADMDDFEVFHG